MNTTFTWSGYWKPTPRLFRRFGDAFFGTFGTIGITAGFTDNPKLASTFFIVAMAGKFLSNFFKEDTNEIEIQTPVDTGDIPGAGV